jgi:hypothetical protein
MGKIQKTTDPSPRLRVSPSPRPLVKEVPMIRVSQRTLKIPAASCRESSIHKEVIDCSHRSLTPQKTPGNALAAGFKTVLYGIAVTITWLLTTVFYLLAASH